MKRIICLLGPTAIGKTDLACQITGEFPIQLINVDSAQMYKGLDIGTGKPPPEILGQYPHALINMIEPWENFSAALFAEQAALEIRAAHEAGKIPLLVGGTMLYFRALFMGLSPIPKTTEKVRTYFLEKLSLEGLPALYEALKKVDPILAGTLKPQDTSRILRGLEVHYMTGMRLSALRTQKVVNAPSPIWVGLLPETRSWLHERISARFHAMLAQGLVAEVDKVYLDPRIGPENMSLKMVGYRQVVEYLKGHYDYATMIEKAIAATRQLAKRQITWMRSWPELTVFNVPNTALQKEVCAFIKKAL